MSMKSRAPKPRTRQALWSVKQEKPELFEQHEQKLKELQVEKKHEGPPGFEKCAYEGWLHHPGHNSYFETRTGRLCWLDPDSKEFRDLREGSELTLSFGGGATSCLGKAPSAASAASPPPSEASAAEAKVLSVVIPDMHRAAQALKVDFGHLDRPAAMVALFGTCPKPIMGVAADVVARAFHERLIKKLARHRGEWEDEALGAAISETLEDISSAEGKHISAAVAVAIGSRVAAHAVGGCRLCIPKGTEVRGRQPSTLVLGLSPSGPLPQLSAVLLTAHALSAATAAAGAAAAGGGAGSVDGRTGGDGGGGGLDEASVLAAAAPHLERGRPRAASAAILQLARDRGLQGRMGAACVRLSPTTGTAPSSSSSAVAGGEPPAKRPKTAPPSKVRVRQIFLLHWRGQGAKPVDPIRRKPVSRGPEEAEAQLLKILESFVSTGGGNFTAACKASSECQSALKGGDLIGDLGWLDRAVEAVKPNTPSAAVKSVVPASVRKAAFELEIGELSDIVASDRGVHLLLRTA